MLSSFSSDNNDDLIGINREKANALIEETLKVLKGIDSSTRKALTLFYIADTLTKIHSHLTKEINQLDSDEVTDAYQLNDASRFFINALTSLDTVILYVILPSIREEFARDPEMDREVGKIYRQITQRVREREEQILDSKIPGIVDDFINKVLSENSPEGDDPLPKP